MNDHLREFNDFGFTVFKDAIALDRILDIRESLRIALVNGDESLNKLTLDDLVNLRESEDHNLVYNASISVGSSFASICLLNAPLLVRACEMCSGVKFHNLHPMPLHIAIQSPNDSSYDYKWHQESSFYDWCPDILNIWFPLVRPSKKEDGTMSVIPGSHKNGGVNFKSYKNTSGFRQLECDIPNHLKSLDNEEYIEIELGDFVIFDANLIHRSEINKSSLPRYSGILRVVNMANQPNCRALYKAWSNN
jgi:ectoine hydroxylase-related dioxygenase (phytanoyl-CoA dioxygenase family)